MKTNLNQYRSQESIKSSKKSLVDARGLSWDLKSSKEYSQNNAKRWPEVVIPALSSVAPQPSQSHMGTKAKGTKTMIMQSANRAWMLNFTDCWQLLDLQVTVPYEWYYTQSAFEKVKESSFTLNKSSVLW